METLINPVLALVAARSAMAPAAAPRAEPSGSVLEIVSFRLKDRGLDCAFMKAAQGTQNLLRAQAALDRHAPVRDATALWTVLIGWTSMQTALDAAEKGLSPSDVALIGAMIGGDSVQLRAPILWQMD